MKKMKMYTVYFENRFSERIYIGDAKNNEEIHKIWRADLNKRNPNYKVPYVRSCMDATKTITYDIGSWSEFYIAIPVN